MNMIFILYKWVIGYYLEVLRLRLLEGFFDISRINKY